ncbi:protease modulator HflC [Methylococcus capsulatus]|uniref:Protein HflC n=1 Tax=Methylococcus capsulatus (strain ATCC 33009 / NCIMB 11132 / Bath) TaxID=243233 RepID=Q606N6_METCA|nr:protease modulator HflC [Methylococcus capsulatus]AAU91988.1 hflC protein [Methylococcus capsulatus str. Bath]QXP87395.1 protease modulator HflC [Methylococcus capsulatus]QXP91251.1 protease modulator HflC [Methylococcus capsulatus]QXP92864.1 protease modulator HflC [Methylococcus capsulatus]UQN12398.1 protease modulator HflC [Methylococcus capsulatus]
MVQTKVIIAVAGAAAVLASLSVFTVSETQKVIRFRLGEIVQSDYTPGIYLQVPFINNVKKFDGRILTLESKPERFLTSEKKNVIVDSFVKWRVKDVAKYYTTVAGDVIQANIRLDQIVKDAMRSEFSKRTIRELVSSERSQIRDVLSNAASPVAEQLGIQIVDVRVMRIDLPSEVSSSVYRRMEAERARVARDFRSRGAEAAERIRADADRQREVILADAYRDSELKRGEGEAAAADIYAQAYGKNKEFFSLYRSLSAYRTAIQEDDTLVLEPDSEFFRYFKKSTGK